MDWRGAKRERRFQFTAVLAVIGIPALLALTGISTLADSSPTPAATGGRTGAGALPGDPAHGAILYGQNCATCHGANLEGGIGATLNPIDKLPGVANPLDPASLIAIITNGRKAQPGDPKQVDMPAKGGNPSLTDQDVKDLASYIIQMNQTGQNGPLSPGELAKRTILWVSIGIIAMVFITYLLAQYNMRWIARRAAARRK
ncbi:MAG TPA: cytochrome c [Candidatus Dormibacteraeota bacterium]|nr:cytochrome c [Candidatus Dormibacteraeota bacterium]